MPVSSLPATGKSRYRAKARSLAMLVTVLDRRFQLEQAYSVVEMYVQYHMVTGSRAYFGDKMTATRVYERDKASISCLWQCYAVCWGIYLNCLHLIMSREKDLIVWSVGLRESSGSNNGRRAAKFKKHLEDVFDIVGPKFSASDPLSHLASDAAFPLIYAQGVLLGSIRKVSRAVNVTVENKTCTRPYKHSLKCLLRLYFQIVSEDQNENLDISAIAETTNELAGRLETLEQAIPISSGSCPGRCLLGYVEFTQRQLDGLMYMFNLVSDYILARSVQSTAGSDYIQQQITMAWFVVPKLFTKENCLNLDKTSQKLCLASPRI